MYRAIIALVETLEATRLRRRSETPDDHMPHADTIVYSANGNLYVNLTNRCSCACTFCLREFTTSLYGYDLLLGHEPGAEEVTRHIELAMGPRSVDEVVFCGLGEPTLRLDVVLAVTEWCRVRRLTTRLDTNGLGSLANPGRDVPTELAAAGLDAVSVSLNAPDPISYDQICRPLYDKAFREVVRFARACVDKGIRTTLTALDGVGADLAGCAAVAAHVGAEFRVRGAALPPARSSEPAASLDTRGAAESRA